MIDMPTFWIKTGVSFPNVFVLHPAIQPSVARVTADQIFGTYIIESSFY
jgi:hypothetical protein